MSRGPLVLFGLFGAGAVVALVAAGGGNPVQGAQRLGGLVQGQVGRFFSWAEMPVSGAAARLGLDNTPPPAVQPAMLRLVEVVLDPLRVALGRPVRVTSGYRAPAVNRAINGSPTSQHMLGEAADIKVEGLSAEALATAIVQLGLPVDQVIWYAPERGGHVHVSFTDTRPTRRQALHAPVSGGYNAWAPASARVA